MEPIPAIGIVVGLAKSLGNTLQLLQDVASRFASQNLRSDLKGAETAISISRADLMTIHDNLNVTSMHSQANDLLDVLEDTEMRLNGLRDSIRNVETLRSKLFLRWQSRVLLRRDMDDTKSSIVLALEMVEMIRIVQGDIQHAKPLIEVSR